MSKISGEANPNWKGGKIKVICDACGKHIDKALWEVKKYKHHFCNRSCYAEWQSKHIRGRDHPSWKGGKIQIKCSNCDKSLRRDSNEIRTRKRCFCNASCQAIWKLENTNERERLREIRAKIAKPTRPERMFEEICQKYNLPFRYVGDGQLWIGKKGGRKLNPDFIECNGKKIVIEIMGEYWHSLLLNPKIREEAVLTYREKHFRHFGWKSIFFWDADLLRKDTEQFILNKLKQEGVIETTNDQQL